MKNQYSDLAINYAFQSTINWGGRTWKLTEEDTAHLRTLIDEDNLAKTGESVWQFFRSKFGNNFYTSQKLENIGKEFINNLQNY